MLINFDYSPFCRLMRLFASQIWLQTNMQIINVLCNISEMCVPILNAISIDLYTSHFTIKSLVNNPSIINPILIISSFALSIDIKLIFQRRVHSPLQNVTREEFKMLPLGVQDLLCLSHFLTDCLTVTKLCCSEFSLSVKNQRD